MAESMEEEPPVGVSLEGFWQAVSNDADLRAHLLSADTLFKWPSPAQIGVLNFETMRPNSRIMHILIENWCPQVPHMKTIYAVHAREEAALF